MALDCIPCLAHQALEADRFATDDPSVHEQIARDVLRPALEMDSAQCPPMVGQKVHRQLRGITGVDDPYRAVKDCCNRRALEILAGLRGKVRARPTR